MKKFILSAIIFCFVFDVNAQQTNFEKKGSPGIRNYPWKVTTGAEELLNSYRRLTDSIGVGDCDRNIYSVAGYMPAGDFTYSKDSGYITFSSYFDSSNSNGGDVFRNVFDFYVPYYYYYGLCPPNPIIWSASINTENDVFEAFLISVDNYKNAPDKSYATLRSSNKVIYSNQFDKIITWGYESNKGYIATSDHGDYSNIYSSLGLRVKIHLKGGKEEWCYLLNNYDGAGTITWKAPTDFIDSEDDEDTRQAAPITVKLSSALLQQNQPNPFTANTVIAYTLPAAFTKAFIKISDASGHNIKIVNLTTPGNGSVQLDAFGLNSGTYSYALYVDGALIDNKKMLVIK